MVLVSSNDNGNAKKVLSKLAKGNGHGEDSSYFDGWKAYDSDPFHPIINPRGVIQMGLAENQVLIYVKIQFSFTNFLFQFHVFDWWVLFEIAAFF